MFKLLHFLKPYKKQVILGPIFKLLEAIFELMIPTIMVVLIDRGIKYNDISCVLKIGGLMIIMAIAGVMSSFTCQYYASIVSQGFGTRLRNALFDKIGTFSHNEIDSFGTSSLINRITNDVNQLQVAVAMLIRLAIRVPFLCVGGVIMAMFLDIKLSTIMILTLPLFAFVLYLIMSKSIPLYKLVQKKLDALALVLRENLSGIRVIRAFARVEYEKERFKNSNEDFANTAIRVGKISSLMNPMTNILMNFSIIAILWFGGMRVNIGAMTQGQIIAYINYNTLVLSALIIVANLVVIFTKAFASASRVNEIFDTVPSITDNLCFENDIKVNKDDPVIEFKNVSFMYKDSKEYAIKNISFEIKRGQTVGIIGGTGSGKTTLINLIPRFYDTSEGKIMFNGIEVKNYMQTELRNKIGLVPQKAVLFSGTIAENIRWGLKEASYSEIRQAAKTAQASDFIEKLSKGYDTNISQGGVNFSGGQKQRLTIARALVRNPELLILDDSSSALDYVTDAALRKAVRNNKDNMIVIMVTQRVSTVKDADMIIVLDNGVMAGTGKHHELIKNNDIYKEICLSQLEKGGNEKNEKQDTAQVV
ncbi:ABC transporter ATP-binding protein [Clostridium sp. P21]|uniref:ABC transporter ATP-binding protein n=1 Tax=Clostridium muellerianum TaxID=2716538 RepID=A0A7Y0EG90_9CLOT|nr:ABC transporter ATP-binding protein [Clostridium muellerianum]NMM62929.1 ABC transporter ATP-binding protein [Clostridium muellerianum]